MPVWYSETAQKNTHTHTHTHANPLFPGTALKNSPKYGWPLNHLASLSTFVLVFSPPPFAPYGPLHLWPAATWCYNTEPMTSGEAGGSMGCHFGYLLPPLFPGLPGSTAATFTLFSWTEGKGWCGDKSGKEVWKPWGELAEKKWRVWLLYGLAILLSLFFFPTKFPLGLHN